MSYDAFTMNVGRDSYPTNPFIPQWAQVTDDMSQFLVSGNAGIELRSFPDQELINTIPGPSGGHRPERPDLVVADPFGFGGFGDRRPHLFDIDGTLIDRLEVENSLGSPLRDSPDGSMVQVANRSDDILFDTTGIDLRRVSGGESVASVVHGVMAFIEDLTAPARQSSWLEMGAKQS